MALWSFLSLTSERICWINQYLTPLNIKYALVLKLNSADNKGKHQLSWASNHYPLRERWLAHINAIFSCVLSGLTNIGRSAGKAHLTVIHRLSLTWDFSQSLFSLSGAWGTLRLKQIRQRDIWNLTISPLIYSTLNIQGESDEAASVNAEMSKVIRKLWKFKETEVKKKGTGLERGKNNNKSAKSAILACSRIQWDKTASLHWRLWHTQLSHTQRNSLDHFSISPRPFSLFIL